ncbi:hypothetical protein [uncultured Arcticibacterium sp.]|uniref:hypothetical protein n=1 Tax=uncultured Arcticibacterium sp. TaxID=2173042 RepID=UPI0030F82543
MVKRILYFLGILSLYACSDSPVAEKPDNYFPLEDGLFWEYEVTNVEYSLTEVPKTESYFLKEKLSKLSDNEYKIEQFTKTNSSSTYALNATALLTKSANKIIRTDDGIARVILFSNPIEGLSWDENELNTLGEKIVNVTELKESFGTYNNTFQIIERKDSSLISKDCIYSVYADETGLIYKENTDIEYCQSSSECIGSGEIDSGFSYKTTLVNSGKE